MAADLTRAYNIEDLRALARRRVPRMVFDFYDGGAVDEVALRGNRAAFERLRFAPKVLRDVSHVDTGCEILGDAAQMPFVIAPTGGAGFCTAFIPGSSAGDDNTTPSNARDQGAGAAASASALNRAAIKPPRLCPSR